MQTGGLFPLGSVQAEGTYSTLPQTGVGPLIIRTHDSLSNDTISSPHSHSSLLLVILIGITYGAGNWTIKCIKYIVAPLTLARQEGNINQRSHLRGLSR